ncbi:delta adaptin [Heterostelium album PN500]|uniref:AP-3 complex subunit delta n=1 Tax=Heterostelium pallidum (strain ATCC 26659 / Pp 5 / PN500) TaxID=670386 RepID=D3BUZ4_HETP5|nr:delta adaptin [Heterostelium album PN500]EFA74932.1 delta adaptin [Heterostelium album PN500]|eukprot:XP_020427066.1 delta adaptin [Heterostelium album PN500]
MERKNKFHVGDTSNYMFERTLADLVRGIRNHKKNEEKFINQCIQEIKMELKGDISKKTLAVQKLTYISMLGYDISWAAFNIVEVMSATKFSSKRVGYLAASQSFNEGTEVITLATNQIRKDFLSNQYEAYLALNCLSNICTPDLARDLANDLVSLLSTQKTHILKRTITVMYKIFLRYPDSLRPAFPKLKEKLEDPEPSVVSCAVNVICELARKNPKNYLTLAPVLFKILTNSTTNYWMFIKIVKLFGALTPLEPRLAKKLVDPLTNIINTSSSMSLLFECIQTCIIGISDNIPLMKLCISKLRTLIEHHDQNLKYLGLLALSNIMKIHPKAVSEHRELVLNCLDDEDISIRTRALDLLTGMVNKKNIHEIVLKLLQHIDLAEGAYKEKILEKIIELCSLGTYQYITDFEWYINVLTRLSEIHETVHGKLIASQLLDVVIRVKVVRAYSARAMINLLKNPKLMSNPKENGICEVLYAAAWIVGEFSGYLNQPLQSLEAFLQPRVSILPAHIQSVYMQNILKVFAHACASANGEQPENLDLDEQTSPVELEQISTETIDECLTVLKDRLPLFTQSIHIDVQERACLVNEIIKFYSTSKDQGTNIASELVGLFTEALNPVAPKAQKKVPVPEGLDLDAWINDPKLQELEESDESDSEIFGKYNEESDEEHTRQPTKEELARQKEERLKKQANNPYMLGNRGKQQQQQHLDLGDEPTHIPVAKLPENMGPVIVGGRFDSLEKKKPSKLKKNIAIDTTTEMPEGAKESDSEDERRSKNTKSDALSAINLDEPLGANEVLYSNRHRTDIIRDREAAERAKAAAASRKSSPKVGQQSPNYTELASPEITGAGKTKKSSKKGEQSSSSKKSTAAAPAPVVVKKPLVFVAVSNLAENEFFNVTYDLRVVDATATPDQLKLTMKIQNKSDEDLSDVKLSVKPAENTLSLVGGEEVHDIGIIESGSSTTITQLFKSENILAAAQNPIQFSLSATPSSSPDVTVGFEVATPINFFIVGHRLTKDKFADILQNSGQMPLSSVKVAGVTSQSCIDGLRERLQFEVVQIHPSGSTISFYAKTVQQHHIAMLCKDRDGVACFDVKSSDATLSQLITKEIKSQFTVSN